MKHDYKFSPEFDLIVDGRYVIRARGADAYEREAYAHSTLDYILENEDRNLADYIELK
jgi:hypothetical protein